MGRAGAANCCGAERWAGGGRVAQGLPLDSGRSRAAAGVGRTRRPAGLGRRGFEAGPRAREAALPPGSCPAVSLPSSRKKAGAGGGPQNLLATWARSLRGPAASWVALPDVPAEG